MPGVGEWGEERGEGRVRGEGEESRRRELEKVEAYDLGAGLAVRPKIWLAVRRTIWGRG